MGEEKKQDTLSEGKLEEINSPNTPATNATDLSPVQFSPEIESPATFRPLKPFKCENDSQELDDSEPEKVFESTIKEKAAALKPNLPFLYLYALCLGIGAN